MVRIVLDRDEKSMKAFMSIKKFDAFNTVDILFIIFEESVHN